jgi:hypothetical protein
MIAWNKCICWKMVNLTVFENRCNFLLILNDSSSRCCVSHPPSSCSWFRIVDIKERFPSLCLVSVVDEHHLPFKFIRLNWVHFLYLGLDSVVLMELLLLSICVDGSFVTLKKRKYDRLNSFSHHNSTRICSVNPLQHNFRDHPCYYLN